MDVDDTQHKNTEKSEDQDQIDKDDFKEIDDQIDDDVDDTF